MCGRYITPDEAALEREWSSLPRDVAYFPSYNFAPTMRGPVVIDTDEDPDKINHRQRAVTLVTWGFQPHWAKRINARAETVFDSRAFARDTTSAVLVITSGWQERTRNHGGNRTCSSARTAAHSRLPASGQTGKSRTKGYRRMRHVSKFKNEDGVETVTTRQEFRYKVLNQKDSLVQPARKLSGRRRGATTVKPTRNLVLRRSGRSHADAHRAGRGQNH